MVVSNKPEVKDTQITELLEYASRTRHRSLFLLIGDRGKDQIVRLYNKICHSNHTTKMNVLWCYKDKPDFGSLSKSAQRKIQRLEIKAGMSTEESRDAFHIFLSQTNISYCYYKDSKNILGRTFGLVILQDFEALTPNIMARTIETAEGGGAIIIMIRNVSSLSQVHSIIMDAHARFKPRGLNQTIVPRFNRRFILSLADCPTFLCVDDELNILNAFKPKGDNKSIREFALKTQDIIKGLTHDELQLANLKSQLSCNNEIAPLINICRSSDQVKTVLSFMHGIVSNALGTTFFLTAARWTWEVCSYWAGPGWCITAQLPAHLCAGPHARELINAF